jgi:hypothetical protein
MNTGGRSNCLLQKVYVKPAKMIAMNKVEEIHAA